jgi:lysophospholipase L1-like esterase
MKQQARTYPLAASLAMFVVACSGTSTEGSGGSGGPSVSGGSSSATGGNTSVGGHAPSSGGQVASGGSSAVGGAATGGASAAVFDTGGVRGTGGAQGATGGVQGPTGGSRATTGGTQATTGGVQSLGGSTSIGGASSTGGSKAASGGATSQGGATTTGGTTVSGGVTSTGGSKSTGGATGTAGSTGAEHWVGTWTASPYYDSANPPPASLANSVLRQVVHVSLGGSQIRVQFSNLSGNGSVTISSAHIALCKATPAVDSTIDVATDKALAFSGTASVTIAQGKEVWSDPIAFTVPNQGNITITAAFASVPSQVVGHSGSRTTSYLQTGSTNVSAASMTSAQKFQHWYYISGIDVMASSSANGIVAIGDSITDGRGTDDDHNNRWTDIMAARLQANAATSNVATMNQGIGATNLIGTSGTAAQARFARDVLGQSGVRYVIVYDGVNDIGGGASFASMKTAYDDLISRAHGKGLLIYGATILPFSGNSYYTAAHESVRQQVNTYVKGGAFDGVIDFDTALTDGGNPPKLQATYAAWTQQDWLHPGPAGYQKMGNSVDLTLFTK